MQSSSRREGYGRLCVRDLAVQKQMNDLVVGTFGRGIYVLDDYTPLRRLKSETLAQDTVLFPALRTILKPKQVEELGERMEGDEKKILGDEGFEKSVDQVATIEKQLGIYELAQFTPKL